MFCFSKISYSVFCCLLHICSFWFSFSFAFFTNSDFFYGFACNLVNKFLGLMWFPLSLKWQINYRIFGFIWLGFVFFFSFVYIVISIMIIEMQTQFIFERSTNGGDNGNPEHCDDSTFKWQNLSFNVYSFVLIGLDCLRFWC